jgi:protein-L-isoaspartate(D-aspartate) O-methyltransferase
MAFSNRKYKKHREKLVNLLRNKGIQDEQVLRAVEAVPRHKMLDTVFEHKAYKDTALPIGKGQTISQPYTVAKQTELLQLTKGDKVLEIGTGSGYQAAILCEMGMDVYSIERHKELYERARSMLRDMGYRPHLKLGDGSLGWSAYAPYDAIVVTAGAPSIPEHLEQQLTIGGRLVVPVGDSEKQVMVRVTRVDENNVQEERFDAFKFVPLIGEEGWEE